MNIGEKLYELRKAKNLSQEEVADRLNVTRQTVSKWETNQSTPDFDKIMPLCELFEIGTEELLTGKKPDNLDENSNNEDVKEEKIPTRQEVRVKSAEVVSTSVFIYILSIAVLIVGIVVLRINPVLVTAIFLIMIAWATARIIKHYMSIPKFEKSEEEKKEEGVMKQIEGIVRSNLRCNLFYSKFYYNGLAYYMGNIYN